MLHLRVLEVLSVDRFMARSVIVSSETERPGCGGFFKGPLMSIVSPLGLIYDRRGSCEVANRPVVSAAPVANRNRYCSGDMSCNVFDPCVPDFHARPVVCEWSRRVLDQSIEELSL